jgi:hypothetical protein
MSGAGQTIAVIESLIETQYIVGSTLTGQVRKTAPYLWVLSVGHASPVWRIIFVVSMKFLENVFNPGCANLVDGAVAVSYPVDITVHYFALYFVSFFMMSKNVTRVVTYKQGYRHTLRICNYCCFSTAAGVKRTCFYISLYLLC